MATSGASVPGTFFTIFEYDDTTTPRFEVRTIPGAGKIVLELTWRHGPTIEVFTPDVDAWADMLEDLADEARNASRVLAAYYTDGDTGGDTDSGTGGET